MSRFPPRNVSCFLLCFRRLFTICNLPPFSVNLSLSSKTAKKKSGNGGSHSIWLFLCFNCLCSPMHGIKELKVCCLDSCLHRRLKTAPFLKKRRFFSPSSPRYGLLLLSHAYSSIKIEYKQWQESKAEA